MSPLRQQMIAHMRCRHFSPRTEESYLHAVEQLYKHYARMPDRLSRDEVVAFLAHCVHGRKLSRSTVNVYMQSCRFLYEQVLKRDPLVFKLPKRSRPKTRPQMLSPEECRRVIEAPKGLKHRALLHMVYGSGLRVSEVVRLLPQHIESDRMMVFVKGGKGGKDRYTVLSEKALEELRAYWRRDRPAQWLFPGRPEDRPLTEFGVIHPEFRQHPDSVVFLHVVDSENTLRMLPPVTRRSHLQDQRRSAPKRIWTLPSVAFILPCLTVPVWRASYDAVPATR